MNRNGFHLAHPSLWNYELILYLLNSRSSIVSMFACLCKYKAERSPRATSLAVDFCVCLLIAYISAIHVFTILFLYNLDLLSLKSLIWRFICYKTNKQSYTMANLLMRNTTGMFFTQFGKVLQWLIWTNIINKFGKSSNCYYRPKHTALSKMQNNRSTPVVALYSLNMPVTRWCKWNSSTAANIHPHFKGLRLVHTHISLLTGPPSQTTHRQLKVLRAAEVSDESNWLALHHHTHEKTLGVI